MMHRPADKPALSAGTAVATGPHHERLTQLAADLNAGWADRAATVRPPNRTGLPDNLKAGVEALSGMSMDHVRVHRNSSRPAQLQAHAFAQGSDVHLAPGQDHHLPHEAWHVVQQAQGRVRPTLQMKGGVAINNDQALESEADRMGAKASARGMSMTPSSPEHAPPQAPQPVQAAGLAASRPVAQLYGDPTYVPNLAGLTVPGGGGGAYNFGTFGRPAGWYDGTLDSLFAALPPQRVHHVPLLNITLVQCAVANTWHNINDMQIGHIQNWATYVQGTQPATIREATNAYNDLNNLRLENGTANASHDFEAGRDSEDEDGSGSDDDFIDKSDGGVMSPEARKGLDEYKQSQSRTYI